MNSKLLRELCLANGISGNENSVREIIIREINGHADELKTDPLGNLLVFKKGAQRAKHKLLLSAHMDEVGFIVTEITSEGFLKFEPVGGIDRRVVLGDHVTVGDKQVNGVIGIKPVHLCTSARQTEIPPYKDMYIDIGALNQEDALQFVQYGDPVYFKSFYEDNGVTVKSKALDDRAGCCILIELLKKELPYDLYFSFVVQEEVGLCGAKTASYTINPEFALVLESTTAADIPGVEEAKQVCSLYKGGVVSFMDKRTIYDKTLVQAAFACGEKTGVKVQYKKAVAGGNDAGVIHQSRGGVRTLALSLPCRYLHSPLSIIAKGDYDSVLTLCEALSEQIAGGNI